MKFRQFTNFSDRRCKLFYDDDVLLSVESAFNVELYKRIHFKDLQSIQVIRTASWMWVTISEALLAVFFVVIAATTWSGSTDVVEAVIGSGMGVIACILIALIIYNVILGPSCRTYACSAVQKLQLHAINRVRRVDKFLKTIEPMMTATQGSAADMDVVEAVERLRELDREPRLVPKTVDETETPSDTDPIETDDEVESASPSLVSDDIDDAPLMDDDAVEEALD